MSYLTVKNWNRFQHYKNRKPPWIKFYTEVIEEFDDAGNANDIFALSDSAKLTLLLAWLLASHFGGHLPDRNSAWFRQRLGIEGVNLKELMAKGFIDASNDASSGTPSALAAEIEGEIEKDSCSPAVNFSDDFLAFWQTYPKKKKKGDAWKAWKQVRKSLPPAEDLLESVRLHIASWDWRKNGGEFIPLPATYLRSQSWEDEMPHAIKVGAGLVCINDSRPRAEGSEYCSVCLEGIIARRKAMGIADSEVE